MTIERALLQLEREMALTAWWLRTDRMTPREHAIYCNGLASKARTQEGQEKTRRELERYERVMSGG